VNTLLFFGPPAQSRGHHMLKIRTVNCCDGLLLSLVKYCGRRPHSPSGEPRTCAAGKIRRFLGVSCDHGKFCDYYEEHWLTRHLVEINLEGMLHCRRKHDAMMPHNLFSLITDRLLLNSSGITLAIYNVLLEVMRFKN